MDGASARKGTPPQHRNPRGLPGHSRGSGTRRRASPRPQRHQRPCARASGGAPATRPQHAARCWRPWPRQLQRRSAPCRQASGARSGAGERRIGCTTGIYTHKRGRSPHTYVVLDGILRGHRDVSPALPQAHACGFVLANRQECVHGCSAPSEGPCPSPPPCPARS